VFDRRQFMTLSDHLCVQHDARETARRAGPSALPISSFHHTVRSSVGLNYHRKLSAKSSATVPESRDARHIDRPTAQDAFYDRGRWVGRWVGHCIASAPTVKLHMNSAVISQTTNARGEFEHCVCRRSLKRGWLYILHIPIYFS